MIIFLGTLYCLAITDFFIAQWILQHFEITTEQGILFIGVHVGVIIPSAMLFGLAVRKEWFPL